MVGTKGVLACALFAAAAAVSVAGAATGPATVRITDVQRAYHRLDGGQPGAGMGDVEVVRQALFNRRITSRAIGHADLVCTFLDRRARTCSGTYFLPKGKLVVGGVIGTRLLYELAVTGGTGLYDNARGTVTITLTSQKPRREFIVFRLTG